ncbi:MAG: hypothetical protein M3Y17_03840 [Actinomycetota bacterium]|nr:hypothetical protein [Actinomycetota bacterium]
MVSAGAALWSYKLTAGVASVAIAFLVVDIARRRGLNPVRAALFFGLNPVLLVYTVSGAHNDLLAVLLAVAAIGVPTLVLFGPHIIDQLRRISTDPQFDIAFSGPDRLASALGTQIGAGVRAACTGAAGVAALIAAGWAWRRATGSPAPAGRSWR